MTLYENLVSKNPMTIEIRRATRRYLSFTGANGNVTFGLLLGIILYAILVLITVNQRGNIHPKYVILSIHLFVAAVIAPMTLHASIAGERERRSWDMLMVAPVTHAQVVVGKLLGGFAVQGALAVAMLLPTLIAMLTFEGDDKLTLYGLLRLELVILASGAFCCALTMLISARVKRAFVSLGVSFTMLLLLFGFLPMMLAAGASGGGPEMQLLYYGWHPVYALTEIDGIRWDGSGSYTLQDGGLIGWPQAILFFAFTAIFTAWTVRTVAFADNEVRFLPGSKRNRKKAQDS